MSTLRLLQRWPPRPSRKSVWRVLERPPEAPGPRRRRAAAPVDHQVLESNNASPRRRGRQHRQSVVLRQPRDVKSSRVLQRHEGGAPLPKHRGTGHQQGPESCRSPAQVAVSTRGAPATVNGGVEGKFAPVKGEYHDCHGNGQRAKLSRGPSLFHKLREHATNWTRSSRPSTARSATPRRTRARSARCARVLAAPRAPRRMTNSTKSSLSSSAFRHTKLLIGNFGEAVIGHAIEHALHHVVLASRGLPRASSSSTRRGLGLVERTLFRDDLTVGPRSSNASTSGRFGQPRGS